MHPIQKKNFILRYVPSMFRLQKGVREYMLETYTLNRRISFINVGKYRKEYRKAKAMCH